MGHWTVVRYLQAPIFPDRKGRNDKGKRLLIPYKEDILKRWNTGCRDVLQLFRTIQRHGYTGSYPTVARGTAALGWSSLPSRALMVFPDAERIAAPQV